MESPKIEELEKNFLCAGAAFFRLHTEIKKMKEFVETSKEDFIKNAPQYFNQGVIKTLDSIDERMHELYTKMEKQYNEIPKGTSI